jgi:hypothetical protein
MAAGFFQRSLKDVTGTFKGLFYLADSLNPTTSDSIPAHVEYDPATQKAVMGEVQAAPSAFTVLDRLKTIGVNVAALTGLFPTAIGRHAGAASLSVALSDEDVAQLGSVTEAAPGTDIASSGLNGRMQRLAQRLTSLIGLLPASLGAKAAAASLAVTRSTEDAAQIGALTETAPGTDIASSGLNGRLQRIAQRLTSLIALVPASLGVKAAASSFAVALSTEDAASIGALTETAPGTDIASSGLNGRLQRVAQRLSTLLTAFATFGSVFAGRMVLYDTTGAAVGPPQNGAGNVTATTARTTLAADDPAVTALQAMQTDTASVNVAIDSAALKLGPTSVTPKFKPISVSASGGTPLITAVSGKKLRVIALYYDVAAAVNVKFQTHGGGSPVDLTGNSVWDAAGKGMVLPFSPVGWFETVAGEALDIFLSGAFAVAGVVVYIEV